MRCKTHSASASKNKQCAATTAGLQKKTYNAQIEISDKIAMAEALVAKASGRALREAAKQSPPEKGNCCIFGGHVGFLQEPASPF